MDSFRTLRPAGQEYNSFYAGYVGSVRDGDILNTLKQQQQELGELFDGLTPGDFAFRYAEGKWSLGEVLGHMIDTEWIFAYRLLRFARSYICCTYSPLRRRQTNHTAGRGASSDRQRPCARPAVAR